MTETWGSPATIVVHHCSLPTLGVTLGALVAAGVSPDALVVVDNSGSAVQDAQLDELLPTGATLVRVANDGYAAAVNRGMLELQRSGVSRNTVLVATHEALIDRLSLAAMVKVVESDPSIGAVGPLLRTASGELWSAGGRLTRFLRLPRHLGALGPGGDGPAQPVDWLDGALVLYRTEAIAEVHMDERYFLYMEEVDYHLQLAREGWRVGLCGAASASQESNGMPSYYSARNIWLFQSRWGRRGFRRIATSYVAMRNGLAAMRGRDPQQLRQVIKGYAAGRRAFG